MLAYSKEFNNIYYRAYEQLLINTPLISAFLPLTHIVNSMEEVIRLLQTGDEGAFTTIFQTYWKKLYAAAYRRVADEQVAQDIVQEIFMQLWEKRDTLNLRAENLEFYLLRSVKNKVINYFTSGKVRSAMLEQLARQYEDISTSPHIPGKYQKVEDYINSQIEALPESMRTIFIMRSKDLSIKQISETLNIAEQTVKNNISKALRLLRKSLDEKQIDQDLLLIFTAVLLTGQLTLN